MKNLDERTNRSKTSLGLFPRPSGEMTEGALKRVFASASLVVLLLSLDDFGSLVI